MFFLIYIYFFYCFILDGQKRRKLPCLQCSHQWCYPLSASLPTTSFISPTVEAGVWRLAANFPAKETVGVERCRSRRKTPYVREISSVSFTGKLADAILASVKNGDLQDLIITRILTDRQKLSITCQGFSFEQHLETKNLDFFGRKYKWFYFSGHQSSRQCHIQYLAPHCSTGNQTREHRNCES